MRMRIEDGVGNYEAADADKADDDNDDDEGGDNMMRLTRMMMMVVVVAVCGDNLMIFMMMVRDDDGDDDDGGDNMIILMMMMTTMVTVMMMMMIKNILRCEKSPSTTRLRQRVFLPPAAQTHANAPSTEAAQNHMTQRHQRHATRCNNDLTTHFPHDAKRTLTLGLTRGDITCTSCAGVPC